MIVVIISNVPSFSSVLTFFHFVCNEKKKKIVRITEIESRDDKGPRVASLTPRSLYGECVREECGMNEESA